MRNTKRLRSIMGLHILTRGTNAVHRFGALGLQVLLLVVITTAFAACASRPDQPPLALASARSTSTAQAPAVQSNAALDKLWQERATEKEDFSIGPGDILEISVPNITELQSRTARVDGNGNILLPLVGSLHVGGLTEPEIIDHLTSALHKYAYHPEISLFIKTYSSRVAGMMGAVRAPGLYVLKGPGDTVRDLIERAGGLNENAAREVLLSPARPGSNSDSMLAQQGANGVTMAEQSEVSPTGPTALDESNAQPSGVVTNTALKNDHNSLVKPPAENVFDASSAYVIPLDGDSPNRKYVNLPVRPGDTLFVPPAGEVSVIGWVYRPAVLPVTHDLTTLGAVSAAGGMLFAADPTSVKIMRLEAGEQTKIIHVNLAAVQKGEAPDVALQANDVVDVGYSVIKIPGYALYYGAQGLITYMPAAVIMGGS
jgi:protein involved in polysaccharide export with SLBB domain